MIYQAKRRKIYLASSWRNKEQPAVCEALKAEHDVYDFRNPHPDAPGFAWSQIGLLEKTSVPEYIDKVRNHPAAQRGFGLDIDALNWCDTCVLLLPCGKSAHLEAGYAAGQGKAVFVMLSEEGFEPELMYLMCSGFVSNINSLKVALRYIQGHTDHTCTGF